MRTTALMAAIFLCAVSTVHAEPIKIHAFGGSDRVHPHGTFEIAWQNGQGAWVPAGSLGFDHFYREQSIDLGDVVPAGKAARLRIVQSGGLAAQLDSVLFAGSRPQNLTGTMKKKLASFDRDVIVASKKSFEFTFPPGKDAVLTLGARVELPKVTHTQFNFPRENRFVPMEYGWHPYTYRLGDNAYPLRIDGRLDELRGREPFFSDMRISSTGHGAGPVYGWVSNDKRYLYAAFDFTLDNTIEDDYAPGATDYAVVYVKSGPEKTAWQAFKITDEQSRYGKADFGYSAGAAYEHRLYELKIPLAELKALAQPETETLELAFGLYGSASEGAYGVSLAAGASGHYLAAFSDHDPTNGDAVVTAQLLSADGSPYLESMPLSEANYATPSDERIGTAYDYKNNRYLVVWDENPNSGRRLVSRLVYPDGTIGAPVTVTTLSGTAGAFLQLVYSGREKNPYLLLYADTSGLKSLPLTENGEAGGAVQDIPVGMSPSSLSLAYNAATDIYLAVWQESAARALRLDGEGLPIGDVESLDTSYADVASDPEGKEFVIVAKDSDNKEIYAQLVTATGGIGVKKIIVPNAGDTIPSIAYNAIRKTFVLAYFKDKVVHLFDIDSPALSGGNPRSLPLHYDILTSLDFDINRSSGAEAVVFNGFDFCCYVGYYYSTVTDVPKMNVSLLSHDFGEVALGSSASQVFTLANTGETTSTLAIQSITVPASYSLQDNECGGAKLAHGEACSFAIVFSPTNGGSHDGIAQVFSGHEVSPLSIELQGTSPGPQLLAPVLLSPENGATGVPHDVEFDFQKASDPEGGQLTHQLFVCESQDFSACEPETIAKAPHLIWPLLLLPGMVWLTRQRRWMLAGFAVLLFVACSANDSSSSNRKVNSNRRLQPNTQYYWKVMATDGERTVESEVWSFTTAAR